MSLSGVAMRQEKSENDDTQVIISRLLACSKESRYMTCLVLTHLYSLPPAGQLQTEATAAHPVKGPSLVQEHFKYWTACAEEC